jgi:hypothetical protein
VAIEKEEVTMLVQRLTVLGMAMLALLLAGCRESATPEPTPTPPPPTATPLPPTPMSIPLSTWIEEGYAALTISVSDGAVELFERAAAADLAYLLSFE